MCAFFLHAARRNELRAHKVNTFDTEENAMERIQAQFENNILINSNDEDNNNSQINISDNKVKKKPKKMYATRGQTTSNTINKEPSLPEATNASILPPVSPKEKVNTKENSKLSVTVIKPRKFSNPNATNKKELEEWIKTAPMLRATRYAKSIGVLSMTESLEDETKRVKAMSEEERGKIFRIGNRLIDACKAGNAKKSKQIIDACKKELLLQWSVCKAFLAACEGSHLNILRLLMANGMNPKSQPGIAHAIHILVTHKAHIEAVRFLVKAGFDVNQPRKPQMFTPIHIACVTKNADMINVLIELGADVNAVANDGYDSMPLTLCRKMGNDIKCIDILKKAGARSTWRKTNVVDTAKKYVTSGGTVGNVNNSKKVYATSGGMVGTSSVSN
jgi:hypothetical protein